MTLEIYSTFSFEGAQLCISQNIIILNVPCIHFSVTIKGQSVECCPFRDRGHTPGTPLFRDFWRFAKKHRKDNSLRSGRRDFMRTLKSFSLAYFLMSFQNRCSGLSASLSVHKFASAVEVFYITGCICLLQRVQHISFRHIICSLIHCRYY